MRSGGGRQRKGVIFDMDGVLAETEALHLESLQSILSPLGVRYTSEHNRPYIGMGETEFWEAVCDQFALPVPPEEMSRRRGEAMLRIVGRGVTPRPGAVELVRDLRGRGIPLAVASSSPLPQIEAILDGIGVRDAFLALVSGESPEVPRGKPAPDIYLAASRALGLAPGECIAVEDSENGVRSARASGCHVIAVPCRETAGQGFSQAHQVLDTLSDFDLRMLGGTA